MIGQKIMAFETITSTNDFLKQNKANLNHGTVVTSSTQSKGRGRKGQSWMSEKGNLYFSFLLSKNVAYKDLSRILFQTSITIIKVLEQYDIKPLIKYPNDIVVKDKKIAGILIETSGTKALDFVSVGVGINVLQKIFATLENKAVSMTHLTTELLKIDEVLSRFISVYNSLEEETTSYLYGCYIKYSVVIGKNININGQEGCILDITRGGRLVVMLDGEEQIFDDQEISLEELYQSSQK